MTLTDLQCLSHVRTVSAAHKNFPGIWHMPNYSLVSWVPKTGKNKKSCEKSFREDRLKFFPYKTSRERKMAYGQQHFSVRFFTPTTPSHTSFSDSSLSVV